MAQTKTNVILKSTILAITIAMLCGCGTAQSSSGCTNVIISMSPCLNYITGNSSTPSSGCCTQLSSVVKSQPQCLCEVLNGGGPSLGLNINQTQALELPKACNVQTPPTSQCNGNIFYYLKTKMQSYIFSFIFLNENIYILLFLFILLHFYITCKTFFLYLIRLQQISISSCTVLMVAQCLSIEQLHLLEVLQQRHLHLRQTHLPVLVVGQILYHQEMVHQIHDWQWFHFCFHY